MCMSDILCVTNRSLCQEDFLIRIGKIASCRPAGIILREKDLIAHEYKELAVEVIKQCDKYGVKCILHNFPDVAISLHVDAIHLPLRILRELSPEQKTYFKVLGVSCHSLEDALEAQSLGCTYIIAGHVFDTDCKKGVPGRGLKFLKNVCAAVDVPVYGIGGIGVHNITLVRDAGACGACLMSTLMECEDVTPFMKKMEEYDDIQ